MVFDPEIHHRRSIRLKWYDYSREGAYFISICTKDREHFFGKIIDKEMMENPAGKMVRRWYFKLEEKFKNVKCDYFIIMPNHVHSIIVIRNDVGADPCVCPENKTKILNKGGHTGPPLPEIIQWFKTMTTNSYLKGIQKNNWPSFNGKLWQRKQMGDCALHFDNLE